MTDRTDDEERVPSSKYGQRRKGRLGKSDGRNVRRLWAALIEAGAVFPDGEPISTGEILTLPNQPFEMNRLSNHLAKKPHLFFNAGSVRIASSMVEPNIRKRYGSPILTHMMKV